MTDTLQPDCFLSVIAAGRSATPVGSKHPDLARNRQNFVLITPVVSTGEDQRITVSALLPDVLSAPNELESDVLGFLLAMIIVFKSHLCQRDGGSDRCCMQKA